MKAALVFSALHWAAVAAGGFFGWLAFWCAAGVAAWAYSALRRDAVETPRRCRGVRFANRKGAAI